MDNQSPLKLHLRIVHIHGCVFRVLTLRPSCGVRFSTNFFHNTWHLLTDAAGSSVLARLLWGLSFQRHAGTVVVIDSAHLVPTPFEADPPLPCMFIQAGLARVHDDLLRALRSKLPHIAPSATVKLQTFGVSREVDPRLEINDHRWEQERMGVVGGYLCYTAPAAVLRVNAAWMAGLGRMTHGTNYHPLAERQFMRGGDGEVQVFGNFRARVSTARVARAHAGVPPHRCTTEDERDFIWAHAEQLLRARTQAQPD
jgi:hypothetical protein